MLQSSKSVRRRKNYGWQPSLRGRGILLVTRLLGRADDHRSWPNCPECKQSATGMYNKKPACTRCGWIAGAITTNVFGGL